jgi:hypothetical protein
MGHDHTLVIICKHALEYEISIMQNGGDTVQSKYVLKTIIGGWARVTSSLV